VPKEPLGPLTSQLKWQVGQGNIAGVFDQLENYLCDNAPSIYNELLAQTARFRILNRRQLAGEIAMEQFSVDETRIRNWLLDFIDRLPTRIDRRLRPVPQAASATAAVPLSRITTEKILGINNLKQVSWLESGIRACKSVCRVLTSTGLGTGFLVAPSLMMTNNHVIQAKEQAVNAVIEFDYQQDGTGKLLPAVRYSLDTGVFRTNPGLDYTLVGVKPEPPKPPLSVWGHLRLNPHADPVPTEHVSIIQHPNGGLKQIVLTANWVVESRPPLLHYTTDTMAGSSGSPVLNDTWHVIAIHHAVVSAAEDDQYVNEGVLMSAIKADAGEMWPGDCV
jgi:V8-like Glu-specific endopeptidase